MNFGGYRGCNLFEREIISVVSDGEDVRWWDSRYDRALSENFIRRCADIVDWNCISSYQKLSESFIEEFADKVNWGYISYYQNLSEEFIREFSDKVDWRGISRYQNKSKKFIKEFSHKIDFIYVPTCKVNINNQYTWKTFL